MALLEIDGLSVAYRRRRAPVQALDDVTLELEAGETLGLVGESGSGKSTLARAIMGLAPIQSGTVRFAGEDVTHARFQQRRRDLYPHVQMVFQDPYGSLNPARTIGRTLTESLEAYGHRSRSDRSAAVREMLARVHLPADAAERYPSELSGGQRQRVAIARALMVSPRLVVCDEPTSALDLSVQAQILNLLRELQETSGLAYLFISHDLEVVRHVCDRVAVLYRGRVMETGHATDIGAAAHPYTDALHRSAPVPDPRVQRRRHREATKAAADIPVAGVEACPFAPRCPHALERCWSERPVLRDIDDDRTVACHRYPAWRAEVGPTALATCNTIEPGHR